jgi:hypothetical protein
MAQLSSPGVSVTVIDESFYTPAAAGTVPLIVVASAENKQNGAATGTAPGTLKANAGKVYLLTSQKDLSDTFGIPKFYTDANNNPIHAGEQNEYGLATAYSFLGVSNRAYVVRADLDVGQLTGTPTIPTSPAENGTYWLDTTDTKFGVFEWNAGAATVADGQTFGVQTVTVITDTTKVTAAPNYVPLSSVGAIGDYAMVAVTTLNKLYFKKYASATAAGTWVEVGSTQWAASWPAATGSIANSSITLLTGDTIVVNGTSITGVTTLTALIAAINANSTVAAAGITAAMINEKLNLFSTSVSIVISGTTVAKVGLTATTYMAPAMTMSAHTSVPTYKITDNTSTANGRPSGSIWVKTTNANSGADWIIKKYNSATGSWITQTANLYSDNQTALANLDPSGGGINLSVNALYVKYNDDEGGPEIATFKVYKRSGVGATVITSSIIGTSTFTAGGNAFTVQESAIGSSSLTTAVTISFTAAGTAADSDAFIAAFSAALPDSKLVATKNANNSISITHTTGGDFRLVDTTNLPLAKVFSTSTTANLYPNPAGTAANYVASLWSAVSNGTAIAAASATPPTNIAADQQLWYNNDIDEVDIMVHNGTTWIGYRNYTQNAVGGDATDPAGPKVSATQPTVQSDGTPLGNGDLWIDTSDLENYPLIKRYNYLTKKWALLDNADQTTENGVLFRDARWNTDGLTATKAEISDLLTSNFLDFDAPDPALYPKGMLLWNLRRSGYNVLKFARGYVDTTARNTRMSNALMTSYYPHRWISAAANQVDGAGNFGRKAVREVVLAALNSEINANQQIRDEESRVFNLMACPGYPETITSLVALNYDRGISAFVVGDTPARLKPDATTISNWGNNTDNAVNNGDDGLLTTDAYLGMFYPWGYTTDLLGNNVVVPPSYMMLRTIALSDNVSYPWFAPAGTRRGGITNVSSVGYIDSLTGEFNATALNTGQRDTLASIHVNPITFITGTGLVNYGQYTRQLSASSLDRINVARLVVYLRRQFSQLAKPYVFEPNDTITRNEIKQAAESLLLELVGQRALYDYLVVCDTSNNTPARIDRSELYLDVAIEPVKAVEFIYIPLRLKNTGEIKGL